MTDLNPDIADRPIEIPASPTGAQVGTGTRDLLILLAALPALIAVFGTRDVTKIVAYIGSLEAAPALGVLITGATFLYRQWLARKKHTNDVRMANATPDAVAKVKG